MGKIPTAEEVRFDYRYKENRRLTCSLSSSQEKEMMIEFAKLHVQAALESAKNKIIADALKEYGTDIQDCWDIESITNAYPLDNIK